MADYIEDPQIAASINDLKRRWPTIGDAADHPLTEFFLKRKGTKKRWLRSLCVKFGRLAVLILVYAIACHMFPGMMRLFGIWVLMAGVWVFNYLERHAKPQKESNLTDPVQLLSGAGDASQWEQLALLPLQYRDVAGICLGCSYHIARTRRFIAARVALMIGIIAVAAWYFQQTLNLIAFVPCLLFLLFSIHVISTNPTHLLHNRIANLKVALTRGSGKGISGYNYNLELYWMLCLAAMVSMIIFWLTDASGFALDISMLAWGFLFLLASWVCDRMDLELNFWSLNDSEKSKYEKRIAEIISRK